MRVPVEGAWGFCDGQADEFNMTGYTKEIAMLEAIDETGDFEERSASRSSPNIRKG
jgi:hypothetical protein